MDTICPYVYQTSVLFKGLCLFIYIRIDSCLGIRINPHSSVGKESACNVGDLGLIPGYGRSPGEGNGNPFQYSCLENPMDRGAWRATVHRIARTGHNLATKPPPPSNGIHI